MSWNVMLRRPFESTQYTSIAFGMRCRESEVRPSMGSVGDCFDNAMCESFFASLKLELVYQVQWPSRAAARTALFEYLELFYNRRPRHSSLGYLSPAEYERSNHRRLAA